MDIFYRSIIVGFALFGFTFLKNNIIGVPHYFYGATQRVAVPEMQNAFVKIPRLAKTLYTKEQD
ncbi:hypothetical protein EAX61_03080 [Dokdonia sinensis]|uniref:Uncharacterized protein n=1 Tax=Dokdonia sinensis TaxID=2479847 RepID=A0A3M0GF87_9FLAO|nr:hypothetical protein EAX61_03080 [Dokdonia sinensis]